MFASFASRAVAQVTRHATRTLSEKASDQTINRGAAGAATAAAEKAATAAAASTTASATATATATSPSIWASAQNFINSPIGPKTTHFWGPVANWGISVAAMRDMTKPKEKAAQLYQLQRVYGGVDLFYKPPEAVQGKASTVAVASSSTGTTKSSSA